MMFLKVELVREGDREGWREMTPGSQLKGKSDTLLILRFLLYVEEKVEVTLDSNCQLVTRRQSTTYRTYGD